MTRLQGGQGDLASYKEPIPCSYVNSNAALDDSTFSSIFQVDNFDVLEPW